MGRFFAITLSGAGLVAIAWALLAGFARLSELLHHTAGIPATYAPAAVLFLAAVIAVALFVVLARSLRSELGRRRRP